MSKKLNPKRKATEDLSVKLSSALPELKKTLGEKKFDRRIRKAAKLLNAGIKVVASKKEKTKKPAEAKVTVVAENV